jgi:hypothetical protein
MLNLPLGFFGDDTIKVSSTCASWQTFPACVEVHELLKKLIEPFGKYFRLCRIRGPFGQRMDSTAGLGLLSGDASTWWCLATRIFEKAGSPSKLMCVPIDYAKKDHLVMFCNGNGEVLRKPFSVKNSVDGVKYLIEQANRSCRHRHIPSDHVFFGGEDVNSYAENFANSIRANVS